MTDHNQRDDQTNDPQRPSQAEGDRATVEEALGEKKGQPPARSRGSAANNDRTNDPQRPSQAEGDRATVEEDL